MTTSTPEQKKGKDSSPSSARIPGETNDVTSPNFHVSQHSVGSISDGTSGLGCGYGPYRPEWLQVLHNSKCFLICLCFCAITQGLIANGLIPVNVTTLQKRFDLTSTEIGILTSIYDVAVILSLLPVSHFGGNGHKPRWMAYGLLIMGVGSFVFASPSFFLAPFTTNETTREFCHYDNVTVDRKSECTSGQSAVSQIRYYYFVLLLGQILHGIGSTPIYTLGITFLDESIPQASSPVYLGIFYALSVFGPVTGFLLGGSLLKVDGDIGKEREPKNLTPEDPLWYGAWWIGFIFTGALSIVVSVPVFSFARRLPEAKENRLQDINQAQETSQPVLSRKLSDFPKALLQLLKNIPYVCVIGTKCAEAFMLTGFTTFLPKIFENYFSLPASTSSLYSGAVLIPGGVTGMVLGGVIVRKCSLRCRSMMIMALTCHVFSTVFLFIFFAYCDDARFVGVNERSPALGNSTIFDSGPFDQCNQNCSCSNYYNPVCHNESNIVYYSSCHAGCNGSVETKGSVKQWSGCSCVVNSTVQLPSKKIVQLGFCHMPCNNLPIFMTFAGLFVFSTAMGGLPIQQIELRCVPFKQRTLAVSFSWIFVRLLGTIPGAILIGLAVDYSCSLWKKCDGTEVSCLRYSNSELGTKIFALGVSLKLIIMICLVIACVSYRPSAGSDDVAAKTNEKTADKTTPGGSTN